MNWKMKSYKVISAFILVIIWSCEETNTEKKDSRVTTLPYYNEATFTPKWHQADDLELQQFHKIPNFELTNQLGQKISQLDFDNKIYITDFFFTTCPGICPKMTSNMSVIQEAFMNDEDILLLSHSVMPATDSVPVLKDYAEAHGVNSDKWHLVTGDRTLIYDLGRNAYFVEEDLGRDKSEDDFLHTENFVLIDKNKHIRGIYNGLNKTDVQQLIADVKSLQTEN